MPKISSKETIEFGGRSQTLVAWAKELGVNRQTMHKRLRGYVRMPLEQSLTRGPKGPKTSRFRGVCYNRRSRTWYASSKVSGVANFLGSFDSEMDAALAYDAHVRKVRGARARLNFPERTA